MTVATGESRGTAKAAPGPNPLPRLSFLPRRLRSHLTELPKLLRDPLQYLLNAAGQYGGVVSLSPGRIYLVTHPECVKHVLQDNHVNYRKGPRYNFLKPTTGEGLLTSEGAFWLRQRRLVQPIFQRKHYHVFARIMTGAIQGLLDKWALAEGRGQVLDARQELKDLTLDILVQSIFGAGLGERGKELRRALVVVADSIDPVASIAPLPRGVPTPGNLRFRKAMRLIEEFVYGLIAERRKDQGQRDDLLSMLVQVRDEETGEAMSDKQVRDEALNMIFGGHQTTSESISWTLYLLSKHPAVARRLGAELASVLRGRTPEIEDLPRLSYNLMVIQEAMRLYPPAWVIARSPIRDDEIGGYHIPSNSLVVMSPYVTQRLPSWWENPEGFDPERFLPEPSASRPRFAYFPFGGGPRVCIGSGFSMLEQQLAVAMIVQSFRLDLAPGCAIKPRPLFNLLLDRPALFTVHKQKVPEVEMASS